MCAPHPQADVECEFGYEFVNHECRPITGLDAGQCGALKSSAYHTSTSKHRLIDGDVCADLARVITDTDGKGNLPGGRGGGGGARAARRKWATTVVVFLVRWC